jgi:hypothetical protein
MPSGPTASCRTAESERRGDDDGRLYATLELTDPELYAEYRRDVPALIAARGGR